MKIYSIKSSINLYPCKVDIIHPVVSGKVMAKDVMKMKSAKTHRYL